MITPPSTTRPLVSVIILNYNGKDWLERCLSSLRSQTIYQQLEIIVADNASPDKSDLFAASLMHDWENGRVIQHGSNLGFCEGNNRAARQTNGEFYFFLNNDTWLEPDCLEILVRETNRSGAQASTPLMLNYEDNSIQSSGGGGFDIFGLMSLESPHSQTKSVFVAGGCCYLIRNELFWRLGGFDPAFFMYADEYDLSWRVWISGYAIVSVPAARMHHRGAANVNPTGGTQITEVRTSEMKRFYTNRNCLMLVLKNCQHILLFMLPLQLLLLGAEACLCLLVYRRWSFIKKSYLDALAACWKLHPHIKRQRQQIKAFRQRNDWQMLRFLRWRLNRWDEFLNLRKHGMPKVASR
jgi:GT2 family glycosyltransferase